MRVETIGDATLYLGDCLEVLPNLSEVGMVFTSPPYNIRSGGHNPGGGPGCLFNRLSDGYESHSDDMDHSDYVEWQQTALRLCWRSLAVDGAIYYQHKPLLSRGPDRRVRLPFELVPDEIPLRQVITWDRGVGFMRQKTHYVPSFEWILMLAKPDFRIATRDVFDVWRIVPESGNEHPAPFPLKLAIRAISTTTAETVMDPFMGSGTTGAACANLGRKFVGIEIEPKYFDIACERISAAYAQGRLFA